MNGKVHVRACENSCSKGAQFVYVYHFFGSMLFRTPIKT